MTELLIIPALALLDRLRGGWFTGDHPPERFRALRRVRPWMWALAMGVVIGWRLDLVGIELALCAIGFVVGEGRGWGGPLGRALGLTEEQHKIHGWQFGPFRDNHWLALLLRGAIWGAGPVVAVSGYHVFLDHSTAWTVMQAHPMFWLIPIMSASMWGGAQLGKHIQIVDGPWESSELWRGALAGLLLGLK